MFVILLPPVRTLLDHITVHVTMDTHKRAICAYVSILYFTSYLLYISSITWISVVSCGSLELPPNSQYVSNKGSMYGQSIVIKCLPGYIPHMEFTILCEADRSWNGSLPNCTIGIHILHAYLHNYIIYIAHTESYRQIHA